MTAAAGELDVRAARRLTRRAARRELDLFPRHALWRWLLRAGIALPLVGFSVFAWWTGALDQPSPNTELLAQAAAIDWSSANLSWLDNIYPPLATVVAAIVPGGTLGLAITGSLVVAFGVQKAIEALVQRRIPVPLIVALILGLGANPLALYTVTSHLPAALGLTFFGLAMANVQRFVVNRQTDAGFRAGLLFMAAALSHLTAILYVIAAVVAAMFIALARSGQRGARAANMLIILYPTVAVFLSLGFLNVLFLHNVFGDTGGSMLGRVPGRGAAFLELWISPYGFFMLLTVLSAWALSIIMGRPAAILISTLVFAAVLLGSYVGLIPAEGAGTPFLLLQILAITLMPAGRPRYQVVLLTIVAALQIPLGWAIAFTQPYLVDWMTTIVTVGGG